MDKLAILGLNEASVDFGVRASRANVTIAGIYDADHGVALIASLRIGCNAFPHAAEAAHGARWVLLGEGLEAPPLHSGQIVFGLEDLQRPEPALQELLQRLSQV